MNIGVGRQMIILPDNNASVESRCERRPGEGSIVGPDESLLARQNLLQCNLLRHGIVVRRLTVIEDLNARQGSRRHRCFHCWYWQVDLERRDFGIAASLA